MIDFQKLADIPSLTTRRDPLFAWGCIDDLTVVRLGRSSRTGDRQVV